MKKIVTIIIYSAILSFFALLWYNIGANNSTSANAEMVDGKEKPIVTLSVESVMKFPNKFKGVLRIEGEVGAISAKDNIISLTNLSKSKKGCNPDCNTGCASLAMPVRITGEMPAINLKDIVIVEGEIKKEDGKMIFVATSLKRNDNKKESP